MPSPNPVYNPNLTINQTYPGNHFVIENAGANVALPRGTRVTQGHGFNVISELLQPVGYNRAYAVGPKNKEIRPYRFKSEFIVDNPQVMESVEATVRAALESATYIARNGWYLTVELIKMSEPVYSSYTTLSITFEVWPRFAMWTASRVTTEAAYNGATKRDFVVFDGYIPPPPDTVNVPIVWETPALLAIATVSLYYAQPVFASGGNGLISYSKVSGYPYIDVLGAGFVEWRYPFTMNDQTVTVRASDEIKHLDRTFTVPINGSLYPDVPVFDYLYPLE
jgi:hypothetical protein